MDQSAKGLKELLGQTQLKDLLHSKREKPLVGVSHTADVGTVLDTLSKHGVLSAPIFVSEQGGTEFTPSVSTLVGFVDVWAVLSAFLQSLPAAAGGNGDLSAEQLEQLGAALCARPVLSLFDSNAAVRAAIDAGDARSACADWELHDDPDSSLLEVIRSCFLPRAPNTSLSSWQSGAGFALSSSPRVPASPIAAAAAGGSGGSANGAGATGHSRHPAASHRIVVANSGNTEHPLSVLSQSDVLRFLAAHHECLRPLGKASLAELGLATGSLHLAAGPAGAGISGATCRPPALSSGNSGPGHGHGGPLPHIPSSPKPPLAGGSYASSSSGGGGLLGSLAGGIAASPGSEGHFPPGSSLLQRASSGGPAAMQMSPPASPRVSAGAHHLLSSGSLGAGHRPAPRRQLVAVHESVTALEAFRVLLQQRVSACAVLAGVGSSVNMRLVGNLSASDLRHLRRGGFGVLALSVKQFLASKPLAPDTAIPLSLPSPPASAAASPTGAPPSPGPHPRPPGVLMAHAPGVYTCQATASLEELVRMLGAPQHGIHRVYVVDPDQRPAGVVTGTDVLQLLSTACSRE